MADVEVGMAEAFWARWNGVAFLPSRPELVERQFHPDQFVLLEPHHARSYQRHKAYFAQLAEAWSSLRSDEFPSPDHLRKFALVQCGFYDERAVACESSKQAEKIAAFVKPLDDFAVVTVDGVVVRVLVAKSQSYKSMGRD